MRFVVTFKVQEYRSHRGVISKGQVSIPLFWSLTKGFLIVFDNPIEPVDPCFKHISEGLFSDFVEHAGIALFKLIRSGMSYSVRFCLIERNWKKSLGAMSGLWVAAGIHLIVIERRNSLARLGSCGPASKWTHIVVRSFILKCKYPSSTEFGKSVSQKNTES
jgi:hypothetical protein